jgi:hypothetical protein
MTIKYGRVITHEGYKNGSVVQRTQQVEQSIPITSNQQLLDNIFAHLALLKEHDSISFTVFADKRTHQPQRIVLVSESKL